MSKFPIKGFSLEKLQKQFIDSKWNGASKYHAPRDGGARLHQGVDLYGKLGEPIYAISSGKVVWKNEFYQGTWGVSIQNSPGIEFLYGELQSNNIPVEVGQEVQAGDVIGFMGDTKTGMPCMLHFEYLVAGVHHDPMEILSKLEPRLDKELEKHKIKIFIKEEEKKTRVSAFIDDKPVVVDTFSLIMTTSQEAVNNIK